MEPFYFKSYNKTIGVACDAESLLYTVKCIAKFDSSAIDWHVSEGHICAWLRSFGEKELADKLSNVKDTASFIDTMEEHLNERMRSHRRHGRQ
ncbi:MAG: hypothetical protein LVQ63_06420 [Thermoplasmatales archaeon]|nr:hypothetical protein [Thermoplasmatales archaeon]